MSERFKHEGKLSKAGQELKEHIAELSALYEVSKSITSTLDLDKALNLITKKAALIIHGLCKHQAVIENLRLQ